jgi:hypothetical protein
VQHLFNCSVEVLRLRQVFDSGQPRYDWQLTTTLRCRVDVSFVRPGKTMPLVIEAGRAPDRSAVAFFSAADGLLLRAGDRLRCIVGPISGTWSVDEIPDVIAGYSAAHHVEVGLKEVAQAVSGV